MLEGNTQLDNLLILAREGHILGKIITKVYSGVIQHSLYEGKINS